MIHPQKDVLNAPKEHAYIKVIAFIVLIFANFIIKESIAINAKRDIN